MSSGLTFQVSDPTRVMKLCSTLTDKSTAHIQAKINIFLQEEIGASLVFLVSLVTKTQEAIIHVIGSQKLDGEIRFSLRNNALERAMTQSQTLDLEPELLEKIRAIIEPEPDTYLAVPVYALRTNRVVLLCCVVNYARGEEADKRCTGIVSDCFQLCLGSVVTSVAYEEERRMKEQCVLMLGVSKKLFLRLGNISALLREIVSVARDLTDAERCSIFVLDMERSELVLHDVEQHTPKLRMPKDKGIAGYVATTKEMLNIRDAYSHPLFNPEMDKLTGFRTKNVLCFPICKDDEVIAVAQMCNKAGGDYFTAFDEETAMAFSIFCGISIMHGLVYNKIQVAQARSKLCNELMIHHMKVSDQEVEVVMKSQADVPEGFAEFTYEPRSTLIGDSEYLVYYMFENLGHLEKFNINPETLVRFIILVRKGYRNPPYHNWRHAFSAMHFAYLLLTKLDLHNIISPMESFMLLVSTLCHDLDHRGTTNSFQSAAHTALASLYSSEGSVMERHHLSQALCILNAEESNFMEAFTEDEYKEAVNLLQLMILATDLANHFRIVNEFTTMVNAGYDSDSERHRFLLLSVIMTSCDLSDQTKEWKMARKTAELIYDEFFKEGDLERKLGNQPMELKDREKANIPEQQIEFLSTVVLPVFDNMAVLFPPLQILVDTIGENKRCWEAARPIFARRWKQNEMSVEILKDPNFVDEVLKARAEKQTSADTAAS